MRIISFQNAIILCAYRSSMRHCANRCTDATPLRSYSSRNSWRSRRDDRVTIV
jgi:hypothetical protein